MPTKLGALVAAEVFTHTIGNAGLAAWTTWSPSYTNLTIGNGTVTARYGFAGRITSFFWGFTLGSTSSVGSGPRLSLPVAAAFTAQYRGFALTFHDTSGGAIYDGLAYPNGTDVDLYALAAGGTYVVQSGVSATVPFTWATGDSFVLVGTYEGTT